MADGRHRETWAEKQAFVARQTRQMMHPARPFVRCYCQRKVPPHQAYKCLYCGEWYCQPCAEAHFGQTIAHYRAQHPVHGPGHEAAQ